MTTASIYSMTDSWADNTVQFTAIKMNVTDTGSMSTSLLMDLQVGGTSKFSVDKNGVLSAPVLTGDAPAATLADAATIAWNMGATKVANVILGGNRTLGLPTGFVNGGSYVLIVKQDGTGSRTLAYNAVFKWPGGTAPTLSTAANAIDVLSFVSDGTYLYGAAQTGFA